VCRFDAKYEEAVVKFCEDNMKEDEKGKWRCLLPPNKLFEVRACTSLRLTDCCQTAEEARVCRASILQSPAFVTKHIRNKQQDKLEAVAKRVSKSMALERFTADSGVWLCFAIPTPR